MTEIKLPNRYGYNVFLKHVDGDNWLFDGDNDAFEYHRLIYEHGEDKKIHAVDPSGGPYLSIGYIVDGDKAVTNITFEKGMGYVVELKPLHGDATDRTES